MRNDFKHLIRKVAQDLRVLYLLPFVLLVWISEFLDRRLWRYWNMKSVENWRRFQWRWPAYIIALVGWLFAAAALLCLMHWRLW